MQAKAEIERLKEEMSSKETAFHEAQQDAGSAKVSPILTFTMPRDPIAAGKRMTQSLSAPHCWQLLITSVANDVLCLAGGAEKG